MVDSGMAPKEESPFSRFVFDRNNQQENLGNTMDVDE